MIYDYAYVRLMLSWLREESVAWRRIKMMSSTQSILWAIKAITFRRFLSKTLYFWLKITWGWFRKRLSKFKEILLHQIISKYLKFLNKWTLFSLKRSDNQEKAEVFHYSSTKEKNIKRWVRGRKTRWKSWSHKGKKIKKKKDFLILYIFQR